MVANQLGVLSMIAMFLVAVFIAGAVLRDSDAGIADLLYATPMRKRDYLGGRFMAGYAVCLLVFVLVVLAMVLGSATSGADPERLGPVSAAPYLWSFAIFIRAQPAVRGGAADAAGGRRAFDADGVRRRAGIFRVVGDGGLAGQPALGRRRGGAARSLWCAGAVAGNALLQRRRDEYQAARHERPAAD